MTESVVLPKIKDIITAVNKKRDILADYKEKLDTAKAELDKAKLAREKDFSFDTDAKVVELEGFISRMDRRYLEEKQRFETELPGQLREVEDLFDAYVNEQWRLDESVQELTAQTIDSFKRTVKLLSQYTAKPSEIKNQALTEVRDAAFKKAFSGQMTFIGADSYTLATAIPLNYDVYQALYSAGRQLGVTFDEV